MINTIVQSSSSVISWVSKVISAIFGSNLSWAALQPLIAIGIACGVIGFSIRTIKSLSWGF